MSDKSTRREFLGAAATASAAVAAVWAGGQTYAAGASATPGPNDTINVGLIGCGGRGMSLMSQFQELPGVRIVEQEPGMLHVAYQGNADAILKWIAQFPVDRIATPQTSLEEAFIQYYRRPPNTEDKAAKGVRS